MVSVGVRRCRMWVQRPNDIRPRMPQLLPVEFNTEGTKINPFERDGLGVHRDSRFAQVDLHTREFCIKSEQFFMNLS
jgi:hypothetical protein